MKTLTIKDLAVTEELDSRAMSAVRGGFNFWAPMAPSYDFNSFNATVNTQQMIGQEQNVSNANGNNAALVDNIHSKVDPVQRASNTNTINIH